MRSANPLYPVFFKLDRLSTLIVGAGEVGYEKLFFILKSSPKANITIIAPEISPKLQELLMTQSEHRVSIQQKLFEVDDLQGHDLIIAATNIRELNHEVHALAKAQGKLINVADTPELCDFYLGSIVTRGQLKVAISTNGQSPTLAKRFRQLLEEVLPEEIDDLLQNLRTIRDRLGGDFEYKVKRLNELTSGLIEKQNIN